MPYAPSFARVPRALLTLALLATLAGCGNKVRNPAGPAPGTTRTWRMGFSAIPPKNDFALLFASLQMWTQRADAAIIQVEAPWDSLLDGTRADSIVLRNMKDLADYYRGKSLQVVVLLDATNGLDRSADAGPLVARSRSIAEPAIQQLYRKFAVAADTILHPTYMGLGAETNLIRAAAPPAIYQGVVQATNGAAADIRARDLAVRLFASAQVEVAWGAFGGGTPGTYVGIAQDLVDFPFMQAVGLSSYPYLGGYAEPEDIPLDYYSRIRQQASKPVMVVEGGWPSESVGSVTSDPQKQARYIRRQTQLLDQAGAKAVFQLTFTDLAASTFPPGSILPLFAHLGLVDTALTPKPALAPWDSAYARYRF